MGKLEDELIVEAETSKETATTHAPLGGAPDEEKPTPAPSRCIQMVLSSGRVCLLDSSKAHSAMTERVHELFAEMRVNTSIVEEALSKDPEADVSSELADIFTAERFLLSVKDCYGATTEDTPDLTPVIELLEAQISLDEPSAADEDVTDADVEAFEIRAAAFAFTIEHLEDIESRRMPRIASEKQAEESCCCGNAHCEKEEEKKD